MSPISTARLNPSNLNFCLSSTSKAVLIPILLNNTNPSALRYSVTPLGKNKDDASLVDMSSKDLKSVEKARLDGLQLVKPTETPEVSEYDEYDDDDDEVVPDRSGHRASLQKTQMLVHIRVAKPGIIRLENVLDASNTEARIIQSPDVIVALCPHVEFVPTPGEHRNIRCAGQDPDAEILLDISGVPPLSLRWSKHVNGKKEMFNVQAGTSDEKDVQKLRIPLAVSLDAIGKHVYALEEVKDGVGNVVQVGGDTSSGDSPSVRAFQVLRRPAMSFKQCSPANPTSMLAGSEVPLLISVADGDMLDAPWDISLKYEPSEDDKAAKRYKSYNKKVSTQVGRKDLTIHANAPGFYTVTGLKGKVSRHLT